MAIAGTVPAGLTAARYLALMEGYVKGRALEAKVVRVADLLDVLFQIVKYEGRGFPSRIFAKMWSDHLDRLKEINIDIIVRLAKKLGVVEWLGRDENCGGC